MQKEKGVSLIITLFIMVIILAVVLSISALLYSEIKVIRNIGNSTGSYYAAESGVEKVLYYDNQVLPVIQGGTVACATNADCTVPGQTCNQTDGFCETNPVRGLCTIYPVDQNTNPYACPTYSIGLSGDSSIFCNPYDPSIEINNGAPESLSADHKGCDPNICDDCEIYFSTTLDNGAVYYTTASVQPSSDGTSSDFEIMSKGVFEDAQRQIRISVTAATPKEAIGISNDCVSPNSNPQGESIHIQGTVTAELSGDTIDENSVGVYIEDAQGIYYNAGGSSSGGTTPILIPLSFVSVDGNGGDYSLDWNTSIPQDYFVYLYAQDNLGIPNKYATPDPLPVCGAQ